MLTQEMEFIYKGGVSLPKDLITTLLGPTIIPTLGLLPLPTLLSPPASITSVPAVYHTKRRNY